jgi:hypothetical protein
MARVVEVVDVVDDVVVDVEARGGEFAAAAAAAASALMVAGWGVGVVGEILVKVSEG